VRPPPEAGQLNGWPRTLVDGLLSVLVAPVCAACERPLEVPTSGPVCGSCWSAVARITPPLCDVCGDPLPSWRAISRDRARCARCRRGFRTISRGRAVGPYEGSLRAILHAFKYDGRRTLAGPLARLMSAAGATVLDGADVVVPVPLHPRRRRRRGYNQAADLAARLPVPSVDALVRVRFTGSQTDLPAARRHANVRDAFGTSRGWLGRDAGHLVARRIVVLVDDVSTTGATLEACARALVTAGAYEVRALTVARVSLGRRP
jgi:ComF family protein